MENDSKSNEGPKKEADGEENNTKLNNRAKNSRKRKRSNVEEETSELEPPPKRKRNTRATAADQKKNEQEQVDETQGVESSMLTQDKVAKAKKFGLKKFVQAFCDAYNESPSQRLDVFWKNYADAVKE